MLSDVTRAVGVATSLGMLEGRELDPSQWVFGDGQEQVRFWVAQFDLATVQ